MIFKTLSLENFRVFNGLHTIELAPKRDSLSSKPVILFGGLNGAGKTSILSAIRLALLGKKAIGNVVSKKEFQDYLAQQINNKAVKEQATPVAKISLAFSHTHQGQHSTYRLERSWSISSDESLVLFKNDECEKSLTTEQVQSFLHELVPPGIGDLFFFDGEKIAELAEDDTGSYLKEAVQKLLGIDVINRLSDDLDVYIKQISQKTADTKTIKLIEQLEYEKSECLVFANKERESEDKIKRQLIVLESQVREAEQKIQDRGGAWAKTKNAEKNKADELIKRKAILESKLLHELDGSFPMALAPNAMAGLINALTAEQEVKDSNAFANKLNQSLSGLENVISAQFKDNADELLTTIRQYFNAINTPLSKDVNLDISLTDLNLIQTQMLDAANAKSHCNALTEELIATEQALESVSINIQRAPDEEELADLFANLRKLDTQKHKLKTDYGHHLVKAKNFMTKALELAKKLEKLYTNQKTDASISKAVERVDATTNVLNEFSARLTQMRVSQLEDLFAQSYRKLARKEDLKLSAKIDSATFDVTLVDSDGLAINRKSMSAGEKQIFAFAILEALGKLSGKVLPVVIDTPLGRLDSKHRDKLVKHYFPEAGEQVILLSTDTEVDEDFFGAMENNISHAFEIKFDQQTKCSTLTEGYFWKTSHQVVYKELV
ncbi:DNA sulfur modification protein DndD [Paraglaciecola hydrolytica]|uniref:DNA sulfur modification protein DndD n=1 Tax=Paraglaciecola hydrolytica TaxID=1799789 RepID=A0A136A2X8_9ALTE|nr:DNA sulfur modification protein DndD [Paraglaciecola hydrolytica]KXI29582.1 DNA sulfur modification protein DndD [Paraglaciecola hydrolytica]